MKKYQKWLNKLIITTLLILQVIKLANNRLLFYWGRYKKLTQPV